MRVYYTRSLLRVVEGTEDWLYVHGRLAAEITSEIEQNLKNFPKDIQAQFTFDASERQIVDYSSEPIVYMPDEFAFHLDIEHLDRLARETLIRMIPLDAALWQSRYSSPIAELWIGGRDEVLTKEERDRLKEVTLEVWALPVRGKVFVLDEHSLRTPLQRAAVPEAIREAGGIVHEQVSAACDYYVTDRPEAAEAALQAGAKRVIDTIIQMLMTGTRD